MTVEQVVSAFREALGWPYVTPGGTGRDCSSSGIDCSGMFVRAWKMYGKSIYHGSNRIWRKYLSDKGTLSSASQLRVGMAVFKWEDRQVPAYTDSEGDYHHIGLVCSVSPLQIIHASSAKGKVVTDSSIKGWTHWGVMRDLCINAPLDENAAAVSASGDKMTVCASSGSTVFMRASPSKKAPYTMRVPVGATVNAISSDGSWTLISYSGKTGWMMTTFLKKGGGG